MLVTVVKHKGSSPRDAGARLIVRADGSFVGTVGGGQLEALALKEGVEHLSQPETRVVHYPLGAACGQCCGGSVELMYESFNIGPRVWLFGAGHVGQALARTLQGTSLDLTVIDARREWTAQLPEGVRHFTGEPDDFVRQQDTGLRPTYAVVMTHRHDLDEDLIALLATKPLAYLGLIGSDAKWKRFTDRLSVRGVTAEQMARVRCPIGIAKFGKEPQEVAISVAAELLSLVSQSVPE